MKKRLCMVMLVAASLLVMTACGTKKTETKAETTAETTTEEEGTNVVNPMVEVEGPEAFEALGVKLTAPDASTDVKYYTIEDIAQVDFKFADKEFTARAAKTADDITGLFTEKTEITTQIVGIEDNTATAAIYTDDAGNTSAVWYWEAAEVQYSLYTPGEIDMEEFTALVMAVADTNMPE